MSAGHRLSALLQRAHIVPAFVALLERGPLGMTQLNEAMNGYAGNSKILTALLEEEGLVAIIERNGPFGRAAYSISLTKKGEELAKLLKAAVEIVPDHVERAPEGGGKKPRVTGVQTYLRRTAATKKAGRRNS